MRFTAVFLFLLIIFCDRSAFAQKTGELTQSRILILLDESSSMIQTWSSGKPKYKAADQLILRLMDSIYAVNSQVEFSLRVFGHQHTVAENNCYDTKNEVAFSRDNRVQMAFRLDDIKPLGVTAIAYSLMQAAEYDLVDEKRNAYSIILITDGGESCGGDICAVMEMLRKNKVYFKPYIVSLEDYPELKNTYACMGDYLQVTKDSDIPVAVNTIVNAFRPIIKITQTEYRQMQSIIANAPSVLKVDVPIVKTPVKVDSVRVKRDTVVTPPPVPKAPEPKVTPVVPKPVPEKISSLRPAALRAIIVSAPAATALKVAKTDITLPAVKEEAPVIVRAAPEKIARLKTITPKTFTIYSQYDSPNLHLKPVIPGPLPPIVIDTPKPVVVAIKIPAPEKIAYLKAARTIPVAIQPVAAARMNPSEAAIKLPPIVVDTPKPVVVAIKIPAPEKIARLKAARTIAVNIQPLAAGTMNPSEATIKLPPVMIDTPKPVVVAIKIPAPEKISRLKAARAISVTVQPVVAARMKPSEAIIKLPPVVIDTPKPVIVEVKKPAPEKIARLKLAAPRRVNVVYVVEERNIVARTPPELPPLKIDIPKLPAGKTATADKTPEGKKLDYDIKIEDAKVTTLEIFLVNSKGQLVTTSPQVALIDPATKAEVKRFYRTVDPTGNPDPQENIPLGTYSLTFPAKKNLVIPNVKIEKNKRNKITVRIKNVSLSFAYFGAPDRPVKEFGSRVIERNKSKGRVQDQLCTATMEYEPGNYHVRINTFPEDVRNLDLDLDGEAVIVILQPGFAKFTSDTKQIVSLWKEDGNKFSQFYQLDLNDPRSQHLQIQPGKYQVHYRKGPGGPTASMKVKQFIVTSNTETETILD